MTVGTAQTLFNRCQIGDPTSSTYAVDETGPGSVTVCVPELIGQGVGPLIAGRRVVRRRRRWTGGQVKADRAPRRWVHHARFLKVKGISSKMFRNSITRSAVDESDGVVARQCCVSPPTKACRRGPPVQARPRRRWSFDAPRAFEPYRRRPSRHTFGNRGSLLGGRSAPPAAQSGLFVRGHGVSCAV